jgi:hypothetical protein
MSIIAPLFKDLDRAAEQAASYVSRGLLLSWLEGGISKSIGNSARTRVVTAALAGALAAGPVQSVQPEPHREIIAPAHQAAVEAFGTRPEDRFLWVIQQIESSGGRNTDHQVVQFGPQKGEKAIGRWGLLQPTIKEIIARSKINAGDIPKHLKVLSKMTRGALQDHLMRNPDTELELARVLGRHVLHRQRGDYKRAAWSWLHGHNLRPEDISDQDLAASDYVKRYDELEPKIPFHPHVRRAVAMKKHESPEKLKARIEKWVNSRREEIRKPVYDRSALMTDRGIVRPYNPSQNPRTRGEKLVAALRDLGSRRKNRKENP